MHAFSQNLISTALLTAICLSGCGDGSGVAPAVTPSDVAPGVAAPSGLSIAHAILDVDAQTYDLQVLPSAAVEAKRANVSFGQTDYRPTGLWLMPGASADVDVDNVAPNVTVAAYVGVWGAIDRMSGTDSLSAHPTVIPLVAGRNHITDAIGGPIYLQAITANAAGTVGAVRFHITGASRLPLFRLGQDNFTTWAAEVKTTASPYVELLTQRAMLTLPTAQVRQVLSDEPTVDVAAIAGKYDEMAASHDAVAGLDGPAGSIHRPREHLLHYVSHADPRYYMYASDQRMAFCMDTCIPFLVGANFIKDGWGPWHETGHEYQGGWEWSQLTEVSVNLYSLNFQRHLGQPSRLTEMDAEGHPGIRIWENALRLRPTVATFDDLPVFERLVPLEQLRIAYGVEFWARLHRRYRDPATRPSTTDDESRRQAFIVETSRAAGRDLRGFLGAWALRASMETNAAVDALALPSVDAVALMALRP